MMDINELAMQDLLKENKKLKDEIETLEDIINTLVILNSKRISDK